MKEDDLKKMRAMFWNTNHELQFYLQQYENENRGNVNLLICAAIEWGLMYGTALSAQIIGSDEILEEVYKLKPKLFPHEYDDTQEKTVTS